jgi:hypothetical protein
MLAARPPSDAEGDAAVDDGDLVRAAADSDVLGGESDDISISVAFNLDGGGWPEGSE